MDQRKSDLDFDRPTCALAAELKLDALLMAFEKEARRTLASMETELVLYQKENEHLRNEVIRLKTLLKARMQIKLNTARLPSQMSESAHPNRRAPSKALESTIITPRHMRAGSASMLSKKIPRRTRSTSSRDAQQRETPKAYLESVAEMANE